MSLFSSSRLTPKTGPHSNPIHGKSARDETNLHLSLRKVIGATTDSGNAFHSLPAFNIYAVCAGSVVVIARVDEHLNSTQSFYRAGPNVVPTNSTPSFYSPPTANNLGDGVRNAVSPFREGNYGLGSPKAQNSAFADSPGKPRASTRTRSANCVALSADCKLLAVGETGYNPRINIFAISQHDSNAPLTVLKEHSNFGVRSVAFSPDCRWLCSLGNVNDGFVFLWSISSNGAARLHSSNKCISNVQAMTWMGNSVITVGTRHVKVWRLEQAPSTSPTKTRSDLKVLEESSGSPAPKIFSGRNCLLGSLVDSNFTCVAPLSDTRAIVCTEDGDICLLDDIDQRQRLERVARAAFKVLCVSTNNDKGLVLLGGQDGKTCMIPAPTLMQSERESEDTSVECSSISTPSLSPDICNEQPNHSSSNVLAVGFMRDHSIVLDANHQITIKGLSLPTDTISTNVSEMCIPAHDSAVLGVSVMPKPNTQGADFMTWSSQGLVLFWNMDGVCRDRFTISLEGSSSKPDGDTNELKVLRSSTTGDVFFFGDKLGNIGMFGKDSKIVRAHDGEINDLALVQRDDIALLASGGRDRTLQLFQLVGGNLEILQTLENEHAATVSNLIFADGGTVLLSSSADRTIVIRAIAFGRNRTAAFFPAKVITLKSSPLCMALFEDPKTLIVSTMDRKIYQYDLKTGTLLHTLKATDSARSEPVLITSAEVGHLQSEAYQTPIIFGVSSTDKSIRAYDSKTGVLLCREYGQLVISDVALLQHEKEDGRVAYLVVSTGLDGTIMIWDLSLQLEHQTDPIRVGSCDAATDEASRPIRPLRKILSKSELSNYKKPWDTSRDPSTPTRSQPLGRVRKKPSRLTMTTASRHDTPAHPKSTNDSPNSSWSEAAETKSLRHRSPTVPVGNLASRTKRSCSDASLRRPSLTHKPAELAPPTDKLCQNLKEYRRTFDASSKRLEFTETENLERELTLTLHAIRARKTSTDEQASGGADQDDPMDGWLAKMIDDRLALRLKDAGSENEKMRVPVLGASSNSGTTDERVKS